MPAALEYNGIPISTAISTAKGFPAPAYWVKKSSGAQPWMAAPRAIPTRRYGRSWPDQLDLLNAHLDPVVPGQPDRWVDDLPTQAGLEDEWLDPTLEFQPSQNEAGDDGDDQARADIQQGRADPEHPEQQ